MAGVKLEMTSDEAAMIRAFNKLAKSQDRMEAKFRNIGRAGQRAGRQASKSFGGKAAADLKNFTTGLVGISAVIGTVTNAYQTWIKNIREVATESRKASSEIVAFAALQSGGTKAASVQQAATLAARFGITNRAAAFDTVQALQSAAGGDLQAGLRASETVFAATKLGVPLELGKEIEIVGRSLGQKPGETLRQAFVAGQASSRDPALLAKAAPSLAFFDDKEFAFAAAAVIGGPLGDQIATFTKAAGIALSETSAKAFQETFKKLGVEHATREQKLVALREAGITKPEQLAKAGLGEIRQQQALAVLLQNPEELQRIKGDIQAKAKPGIFAQQRQAVERELPIIELSNINAQLGVIEKNLKAFSPESVQAQIQEATERIRGVALRKLGLEQGLFGLDFIDESGRVTDFAFGRANVMRMLQNPGGATFGDPAQLLESEAGLLQRQRFSRELTQSEQGRISGLKELADLLREQLTTLNRIANQSAGGSALVPVTEDR